MRHSSTINLTCSQALGYAFYLEIEVLTWEQIHCIFLLVTCGGASGHFEGGPRTQDDSP